MKKILAMLLCCVMLVAMFAGMSVSATEETASATDAAATTDGYYAYLGVQTCTTLWIFRNPYDDATYGPGMADANGTVAFDGLSAVGTDGNIVRYNGTFTDAKLDGDGNYTVSLADPDFADEQYFSLLFVSTNVPLDAGLTFSNVKVRINNKTVYEEEVGFQSPDSKTYVNLLMQNQWNADRKDLFQMAEPCNTTAIEISFDVSGFGYWAEGQEPVEEPAVDEPTTETPADDTTTEEPADDTTAEGGCTGAVAFPAVAAVVIAAALVIFKKRA